ncbi:MAG TPA: rod shape-determining protein MreC [Marmoricola sp.]|nr:rod shape-determining protein MreC [Marmoricola sp.]
MHGHRGDGLGERRPSRRVVPLLLFAALTVMTLDASSGDGSPLDAARTVVGNVVGPVETATADAVRPFSDVSGFVQSNKALRAEIARLRARNDRLESQVATSGVDRQRLQELDGLTRVARDTGYSLVAARVVARGPSQSFSHTVTIDAGSSSGVRADMTVLNNQGLVGRVTRVTRTTATVLLIVDRDSVVGGRLGSNLEIGFLQGRGEEDDRGRLDLDLVDNTVMPARGDAVVTWGSTDGVPYVAGIPIGRVEAVFSSPRESSRQAVIRPFVDFTALDAVGVVVPAGTDGDRELLTSGRQQ